MMQYQGIYRISDAISRHLQNKVTGKHGFLSVKSLKNGKIGLVLLYNTDYQDKNNKNKTLREFFGHFRGCSYLNTLILRD